MIDTIAFIKVLSKSNFFIVINRKCNLNVNYENMREKYVYVFQFNEYLS